MKPRFPFSILPAALVAAWLAVPAHGTPPSGFTADPSSREQSRVLYNTVFQASEGTASGWTGSVAEGIAGTTSQAFKDAVTLRINYFRAMGGVPAVITFSDVLNAADQQAALMMSANNTLSHTPAANWLDYTAAGADAAAKSDLGLGTLDDGPPAIASYIADNGSNNAAVGHRRWLLYPPETVMGTGDVDGTADSSVLGANALYVLDSADFASPAPAARDGYVAWPPPGYVPYPLISPRWSLTYPNADFSAASVTMTRDGNAVPVRLETLATGSGDNTLVWVTDNLDPTNPPAPTAPASETAASVTVANVVINGAAQSFTYSVTPFDPTVPGADTVYPVISGPAAPAVGAASTYTFNAVPDATGYRWTGSGTTPLTLDLDAENGPGDVTITPAGTNLVATGVAASGLASYHFNSYPAETLTPNAVFIPAAGATLSFASELLDASTSETASVQITADGGVTWNDLYTLTGNGGVVETGFTVHTVDLSAYTGQTCTLRFGFAFSGAGEYFLPSLATGWFVDDILLTGAQTAAVASGGDVAAGQLQFAFMPTAAGTYALQVQPVYYGQYTANVGPALSVAAGGTATATAGGTVVTVAATVPQAHVSTQAGGTFTLTRTGDLSSRIAVHYRLTGGEVAGTDYAALPGTVKIKANHASATVSLVPLPGAATGKIKLVVQAGNGYTVGTPASAKIKIVP